MLVPPVAGHDVFAFRPRGPLSGGLCPPFSFVQMKIPTRGYFSKLKMGEPLDGSDPSRGFSEVCFRGFGEFELKHVFFVEDVGFGHAPHEHWNN